MTIGSLFSGIGGLELGLEWAGLGPVLWQVEKDPFCRAVLAKHYPEAKRFDDVCTVGATELASVDLVCGAWGTPEPDVVPVVHGLSGGLAGRRRRARIRALGNSVVPQCAEVVGWVIRELAGLTPGEPRAAGGG